jgi:hypothetical protein
MLKLTKLLFLLIALGCWQCKTKTPSNTTKNDGSKTTTTTVTVEQERPVSRGQARIIAKVIKIKPIDKTSKNAVCAKNPCEAIIKIEKVIGKGAFFKGKLSEGKELEAYFINTLSSTKKILPQLQKHFPGLKKDDRFQTDIIFNPLESNKSKYQVTSYKTL